MNYNVIDESHDPGLLLEITSFEVEGFSSLGYYIILQ